ncbi:MAG TPA: protein translocase subunit SecF [Trebonia sp.]|nr:protein translocase subunit SecF [Trebonia sp.]
MSRLGQIPGRLYRGEVSLQIVRRQKMWYAISGLILLISIVALFTRGLNFGVDFKGGSTFQFPGAYSASTQGQINRVVSAAGGGSAQVTHISPALGNQPPQWQVQVGILNSTQTNAVETALEKTFHISQNNLVVNTIGGTWGGQITEKALEALIIFLVVIVIYLSIAFEWKMAAAAFVALLHDILITIGVYALVGFSVSPTSVIGLLTILGYSLYDTVVVFDKVRENTAGLLTTGRSTYSDAANLALNQTLVRSLNTSLTALIPVASILFIGGGLLGTGTLNDLSLVLFVGMLSGTYSSLCIATPVLADLKEREPKYKDLAMRVQRRLAGGRAAQRAQGVDAAGASAPVPGGAADASDDDLDAPLVSGDENLADGDGDDFADDAEVAVSSSAGRASSRPSTTRQQPRRGGSAQRRPGARKKRR